MPPSAVLAFILALVVIALFLTLIGRYKRCPSNKVLVIYGKTGGEGAAKAIHGGAAFVWPLLQDFAYLDLEPFVVPIELDNALSSENIRVSVPTTVTAAIAVQPGLMQNAAVRLLGLTSQEIQNQAQDIILGQMRAVIATMGIEDINRDRQAFMAQVNDAVSTELEKIGLEVINVNIRDIQDESGYIEALGRKAAAEAINQALIDVAEQEKLGQTGVAERERDRRRAVSAADAAAVIGEKEADRDRRRTTATLDAEAVEVETDNEAKKARYMAEMKVAEEKARQRGQEAARVADGAIRVADEHAQKSAEDARAEREQARLRAEMVVPADAHREQVVIEAEAERQRLVLIAKGDASAILARMTAEAQGTQSILDAKAEGYRALVRACNGEAQAAASFLVIERLVDMANVQSQAISDLPIEKIMVWDGGGEGSGLAGLGRRLVGVLPPMNELAKMAGLDLPEFLGKTSATPEESEPEPEAPIVSEASEETAEEV